MAVALVDSSAIVGYLLADDVLHASAAEAIKSTLTGEDSLAISVVTWSETLHGALLGHVPEDVLRKFTAAVDIRVLDVEMSTVIAGDDRWPHVPRVDSRIVLLEGDA